MTVSARTTSGPPTNSFALVGGGGEVTVEANNIVVSGGGQIASQSYAAQPGGSVSVKASDTLSVAGPGTAIIASSNASDPTFAGGGRTGKGGNVTVEAKNVVINGGGQIASNTRGSGTGGTVTVTAGSRSE